MSENNDYNEPQEIEVKPTYEALEQMVSELGTQLARANTLRDNYEARFDRSARLIGDAGNYIKDNLDDDWSEHAIEILKALDLPSTDSQTLTLTIEVEVTVSGPLGSNFDLSEYDFDIDNIDISCNERGFEVEENDGGSITDISS
jgi:hypothetical protein